MSKKIKNLVYTCVFILLFVGAAYSGWYLAKSAPTVLRDEPADAQAVMLGADATVRTNYIYRYSGHTHSDTRSVLREEVSMTREEFAQEHPNFVLEHFDANSAVLVHRMDGYCPEHYILKISGDELVLYRPVNFTAELAAVLTFELPENLEHEEALIVGKVFASEQEARQYILEAQLQAAQPTQSPKPTQTPIISSQVPDLGAVDS